MERALKLNPPAFFTTRPQQLVPPALFTNKSSSGKILQEDSNSDNKITPEEAKRMEGVIRQQSLDLSKLMSELQNLRESSREAIMILHCDYQKIKAEKETIEKEFDKKLQWMSEKHQQDLEIVLRQKTELELGSSLAKKFLQDETSRFEEEKMKMQKSLENLSEKNCLLQNHIKQQEEELKVQGHELTQMKSYFNRLETEEELKNQVKKMADQLKSSEDEKRLLTNERKLLAEKVSITDEILLIQEKELEQAAGNWCAGKEGLLQRWRCKVLELMVQLKTEEISHADEIRILNSRMVRQKQEISTLQNRLAISEKSHQLKLTEVLLLSERLAASQSKNKELHNKLCINNDNCKTTFIELQSLARTFKAFTEIVTKKLSDSELLLSSLEKRMLYNSKRIASLKINHSEKRHSFDERPVKESKAESVLDPSPEKDATRLQSKNSPSTFAPVESVKSTGSSLPSITLVEPVKSSNSLSSVISAEPIRTSDSLSISDRRNVQPVMSKHLSGTDRLLEEAAHISSLVLKDEHFTL